MDSLTQNILIALAVGVSSGAIGSFVILKRMALVGDALSHVALPGIALALAYAVDPFWGLLVFLLAAAFLVWWLEGKTKIPSDAIVGILFTASLAVGILTIPDTELIESLFGEFPEFSPLFLSIFLAAAAVVAILSFGLARRFVFSIISPELSRVHGIKRFNDLFLLMIFSVAVALGIKLVGALLMGALTIIPAAIARNLSRSTRMYLVLASVLGGLLSVAGVLISVNFNILPGPTIIILGVVLFVLSLSFVRK